MPADNHLAIAGLTDRIRAHETGFSSAVERATREIEGLKFWAGVPDNDQFSMTWNVHVLLYDLKPFGDDPSLAYDQGSHRGIPIRASDPR
jgi:hypothetical protein